jgi:hypothetical protein
VRAGTHTEIELDTCIAVTTFSGRETPHLLHTPTPPSPRGVAAGSRITMLAHSVAAGAQTASLSSRKGVLARSSAAQAVVAEPHAANGSAATAAAPAPRARVRSLCCVPMCRGCVHDGVHHAAAAFCTVHSTVCTRAQQAPLTPRQTRAAHHNLTSRALPIATPQAAVPQGTPVVKPQVGGQPCVNQQHTRHSSSSSSSCCWFSWCPEPRARQHAARLRCCAVGRRVPPLIA